MASSQARELAPLPDTDQDHELVPTISAGSSEFPSRKKVSFACLSCRKRRTRCDGGIPCASCLSRNTECVKDENDDGRRKLALKRRLETLEKDRHLLDDLLKAFRTAGPSQLTSLISCVRNGNGRQDVKEFLSDGFSGTRESSDERSNDTYRKHRHMLGRIQDFVNPPILVPARPWTTVIDDDDFVSHLISLWFTWAHPWWQWVDQKEFLKAMRAQDTSSLVCTKYLVNMILADACLLDTLADDGSEPNREIRDRFYQEAKAGLEAEEGHVSLAYVSTLGVQWTYLNTNGQDQLGNAILYQQIFLCKNLDRWRTNLDKDTNLTAEHLHSVDLVLERLSWTLYTLNLFVGLALEQIRLFDKPKRRKPAGGDLHNSCAERGDWTPYPVSHTAVDWHPECHYLAYISLAEVATMDELLFVEKQKDNTEEAKQRFEKVYNEVQNWPGTLPPCMSLHAQAMPHVIALHALHRWVLITMSKQTASLDASKSNKPSLVRTPQSSEHDRLKSVCDEASVEVSQLLEAIRQNWGADIFPVIIMQPATIAAFALLENLEASVDYQRAFYDLCIILKSASRRFRVNKGVLRLLELTAKEQNLPLPDGCGALLRVVNEEMEADDASAAVEKIGLEYLLEKWDDIVVDAT